MGSNVNFNMKGKWLRMGGSVLALVGAALAGCGQQGGLQPEYPTVHPTQTAQQEGAATAAPLQAATPDGRSIIEPAQEPEVSPAVSEPIPSLTPGTPAVKMENQQDSKEKVENAKTDLAKRLGIPSSEIGVVLVVGQEFTTDGFYCRVNKDRISNVEPEEAINGETILLEAKGSRYEYHVDSQSVAFCRKLQ
jgi:hypothetical protein